MNAQPLSTRLSQTQYVVEVFTGTNPDADHHKRRYCTDEDETDPTQLLRHVQELYDPSSYSFALLKYNALTKRFNEREIVDMTSLFPGEVK